MPFCANCGTDLGNEPVRFCPNCGAPQPAQLQPAAAPESVPPQAAPPDSQKTAKNRAPDPATAPDGLSRRRFLSAYSAGAKLCVTAAVLAYISAGVTAVASLVGNVAEGISTFSLIDAAILLTLGLLVHLKFSRVAAVLMLLYGAFNCVYMTVVNGQFAGYFGLLAGILAVIGAFGCAKDWRNYRLRQSGTESQG